MKWIACIILLLLTESGIAHAQPTVSRFEPAERGSELFVLDTLDIRASSPSRLRPAFGSTFDYAYKPLIVEDTTTGDERFALVRHQLIAHTMASLVFWDRLRGGVDVPIALYQDGERGFVQGRDLRGASRPAFGDVRLALDARLLHRRDGSLVLGAGVRAWLPTGVSSQFMGDGSFRASPQLMVTSTTMDSFIVWSARLGVLLRSREQTDSTSGHELLAQVGIAVRGLNDRLLFGPEIWAASTLSGSATFLGADETPVELIVGAHYEIVKGLRVSLGAGSGSTPGLGAPRSRGLFSIEWAMPYEDPSTLTDRDHDGIRNDVDACPDVAGQPDADPIANGCPPPPPVPLEDTDKDGISDMDDACPGLVGVRTNDPMTNGCPPSTGAPRPLAVVTKSEIKIGEQLLFATDSADLRVQESEPVLLAVKKILDEHPDIQRVRIEGHTDGVGDPSYNDQLSARRAQSVMTWLVEQGGIAPSRLESAGLGSKKPIDTNDTEAGRAKNRRVVFVIVTRKSR